MQINKCPICGNPVLSYSTVINGKQVTIMRSSLCPEHYRWHVEHVLMARFYPSLE
jgi:hypothetical protein